MKKLFLTLTLVLFVIPFGMSQELPSYVPTDGLVAYYPFNGNANDVSGNGNHGTVNGATLANDQNGNENKAYEFIVDQGASWGSPQQEIEIGFNSSMNSNFLTLSAWVNPRVKPSPYNDRSHSIFGRWDGGVSNEIFRFGIGNDNALYFQINDGNNNVENYYGGNIPFDSWTHVAAVLNEKNIKLYVNGQMVSDQLFENNINTTGSSDLTIASIPMANGTWYFFDGYLDEMGYWNRALTEQEVQNLYTSSTGDIKLNGVVSAESNQIKNVADPTEAQDAVTKSYTDTKFYTQSEVDALIANLQQQINEMNQTITSSELEGNWNVKELYYLNPDTNEITSTFPTPECSKPYQYYEFLASKEIFWTGIGTNWVTQSCTSNEFGVKQDPYTITTANSSGDDLITYINFPNGSNTRNWEVISRPSENTIIIRAWQNNEITLYNNEVYGLKLVKEARIEQNLN